MNNTLNLKTSDEWLKSVEFVGLRLLNRSGWGENQYYIDSKFYTDLISKESFIVKMMDSTIEWEFSKL